MQEGGEEMMTKNAVQQIEEAEHKAIEDQALAVEQAKKLCELLQVFQIGVSWGGFESLAEVPYARMTEEETAWLGAQANVIRIHCGLEGEDILIADLEQALSQI